MLLVAGRLHVNFFAIRTAITPLVPRCVVSQFVSSQGHLTRLKSRNEFKNQISNSTRIIELLSEIFIRHSVKKTLKIEIKKIKIPAAYSQQSHAKGRESVWMFRCSL